MSTSKDLAAVWEQLNDRQQTYMREIYHEDQKTEQDMAGAWARGERAVPAAEWRWLDYGSSDPFGVLGRLQERLQRRGVRDPGAGSTLKVLGELGLIEIRYVPVMLASRLEVKLTVRGRAVCRAGGVDPTRSRKQRKGLLSEGLWSMLAQVHAAGEAGLPRWHLTGAWERLTGREPEPYVAAEDPSSRYDILLRLTEAGASHYAEHWETYSLLYPEVDALRPDGSGVWPAEVDQALEVLGARCGDLRARLNETTAEAARLPGEAARSAPETGVRELKRLTASRNRAAQAYDAAVARAADRYRAVLAGQAEELAALHRQACVRYAAATTAAVAAAAAGEDPVAAVADVEPVTEWPWMPPRPVTGLDEVDADLARRWHTATGASAARRGRKRPAPVQLVPDGLEARLYGYAGFLAELVEGGRLSRLRLRVPQQP